MATTAGRVLSRGEAVELTKETEFYGNTRDQVENEVSRVLTEQCNFVSIAKNLVLMAKDLDGHWRATMDYYQAEVEAAKDAGRLEDAVAATMRYTNARTNYVARLKWLTDLLESLAKETKAGGRETGANRRPSQSAFRKMLDDLDELQHVISLQWATHPLEVAYEQD